MNLCPHELLGGPCEECVARPTVGGTPLPTDGPLANLWPDKSTSLPPLRREVLNPQQPDHVEVRENILQEANRLTSGDRQHTYGHPIVSQRRTADLVNSYLKAKYGEYFKIILDHEDISYITILMKIARDMHYPKRDNLTDIAGYARTIEMMRDWEEAHESPVWER